MDYDLVKTFPVKRTEPKAFDELPFPNFSSLNEQVRQQTGRVSLPAVKKMLADNEQFQVILDQNHGMMQKQFLGCVAKHTPPEVFQKCVEQKVSENSATKKHIQCMFIEKEHLGFLWFEIILYKQRLIELFGSYVIGKEGDWARCKRQNQKKDTASCREYRIQNTKIRGKKCELNEESENLKGLFEKELTTYNNKKQCMKMNNKRYEERLQELLDEKEKEYAAEVKRIQVECTSKTMSLELQLEEMLKIIEQKDKFITKQMMVIRAYKEKLEHQ
ncbi:hypothetical protein PROFUN_12241 [Planoprotostelium fungivorum]|uniref:Uncharacterized protein n=1 Tax=Planoprotostelium fungivorum TaxID=1890364 RepID=A0A2P6N810_9EUKA|nr:hypothetical protein PROFUN_12241 [Planoprotostelium fungivorum]